MVLRREKSPHCKRCGFDLEGGEEECPRCQFNPRLTGLRVSMGFLLLFVVTMTAIMVLLQVVPAVTTYLLVFAIGCFGLAVLTFFVSFLATPYRLGSVFDRLL